MTYSKKTLSLIVMFTSFFPVLLFQTHKVQKCLQKLLRSLHKDRHHTIAHYRHLLASSIELAEREKSVTLEHLVDIDHMVNQSLQMLYRYVYCAYFNKPFVHPPPHTLPPRNSVLLRHSKTNFSLRLYIGTQRCRARFLSSCPTTSKRSGAKTILRDRFWP